MYKFIIVISCMMNCVFYLRFVMICVLESKHATLVGEIKSNKILCTHHTVSLRNKILCIFSVKQKQGSLGHLSIKKRRGGRMKLEEIASAEWARTISHEPTINARKMEYMMTSRQVPHNLPGLKILIARTNYDGTNLNNRINFGM